jgi:hypothetical protein
MKKGFLLIGLLLWSSLWLTAQKKIELQPHKPQSIEVRLCDYHKTEGDFLLNLPLTFSINNKNILIIMVGNDTVLDYEHSVWCFSEEMDFVELMKNNRNVSAAKLFKKQNAVLSTVLMPYSKMTLHRTFDDGYEIVKKNVKPFFFEIHNLSSGEPLKFSLQFYVTKPAAVPYFFIAKCKPIEFELIIKQ